MKAQKVDHPDFLRHQRTLAYGISLAALLPFTAIILTLTLHP
ncbi:hypothetical protein [Kitasatospora azatica]|nr:hypothetical protein [Kitasatospora azatica]